MKRPLCIFCICCIVMLWIIQILFPHSLRQNCMVKDAEGECSLMDYQQWDTITLAGTVTQYDRSACQIQLENVYLINNLSRSDNTTNPQIKIENNGVRITGWGQQIQCYLKTLQELEPGRRVVITGKLCFFAHATNPGEFDAANFYGNRDILFSVTSAEVLAKGKHYNHFLFTMQLLKEKLCYQLEEYLPFGEASVMKAMLFGEKRKLDEDLKEQYQKNGIAHILAISGLHISLLGMAFYRILSFLPLSLGWRAGISGSVLIAYGYMVGFSASTERAIIMFLLFLTAKATKRSYDMLTAISVAALLLLAQHPGYLFDCAFQLSFMAVIAMALIAPAVETGLSFLPSRIRKSFSATMAVFLTTSPILIYHYHEISFFSVILNMLVIPLMGALLISGVLLALIAQVFGSVAVVFALPIRAILAIYQICCTALEQLPIGRMNVARPDLWKIFLYYMLLSVMTILVNKGAQKDKPFVLCLIPVSLLLLFGHIHQGLSAWMLDVGQGDCSVIFYKTQYVYLVDGGSTSKKNVGDKIIIPFLKSQGVNGIDAVFVTHPDMDHTSGIMELLMQAREENMPVKRLILSKAAMRNEKDSLQELLDMARKQGITVLTLEAGDVLCQNGLKITCLYPDADSNETGNNASLTLAFETSDWCGIYTGDLELEGEAVLLEKYGSYLKNRSVDVLKVGHHGSSGSTGEKFLQAVQPSMALISCGKDNSYGHPHTETLNRLSKIGCEVLTTPEHGAIRVRVSADGEIRVFYWKTGNSCMGK